MQAPSTHVRDEITTVLCLTALDVFLVDIL